jgi:hypothetical protein
MVHMAAFQLLAGVISHVRRIKGAHVADLLLELEACEYPGYLVLQRAERWVDDLPPVVDRSGGHRPPTVKALARQVEARVDNGQLSSAMSIVERIQDRLDEVPIPAPLSIEGIRAKIQDLHPHASEKDALPPKEGDPPGVLCLPERCAKGCRESQSAIMQRGVGMDLPGDSKRDAVARPGGQA